MIGSKYLNNCARMSYKFDDKTGEFQFVNDNGNGKSTQAKFCYNCGGDLPFAANFCPICGTKVCEVSIMLPKIGVMVVLLITTHRCLIQVQ